MNVAAPDSPCIRSLYGSSSAAVAPPSAGMSSSLESPLPAESTLPTPAPAPAPAPVAAVCATLRPRRVRRRDTAVNLAAAGAPSVTMAQPPPRFLAAGAATDTPHTGVRRRWWPRTGGTGVASDVPACSSTAAHRCARNDCPTCARRVEVSSAKCEEDSLGARKHEPPASTRAARQG